MKQADPLTLDWLAYPPRMKNAERLTRTLGHKAALQGTFDERNTTGDSKG